ncbi:DUF4294 domain-containing protein [Alistipes sp. OttesenSCG-928-B03]|nr:DUF4294 domain-containing protein [Alistipes sp. OttesenSCG-928-B03]
MNRGFKIFLIVLALCCTAVRLSAQRGKPTEDKRFFGGKVEVVSGDTTYVFSLATIPVFSRPADMRKHARLVNHVKKVYPIAKEAKLRLARMEEDIVGLKGRTSQQAYIKKMEKELMREYTPVLKKMTFSQGKILIKLIDRETDMTTYDIVKELRGNFRASFWQGVATLFEADLKASYDKDGEDKVIEQIIVLYEAGLL